MSVADLSRNRTLIGEAENRLMTSVLLLLARIRDSFCRAHERSCQFNLEERRRSARQHDHGTTTAQSERISEGWGGPQDEVRNFCDQANREAKRSSVNARLYSRQLFCMLLTAEGKQACPRTVQSSLVSPTAAFANNARIPGMFPRPPIDPAILP